MLAWQRGARARRQPLHRSLYTPSNPHGTLSGWPAWRGRWCTWCPARSPWPQSTFAGTLTELPGTQPTWASCPRSRTAAPCCVSAPATPATSRSPTRACRSPSRVFSSTILFHCNTNLLEPHPTCRRQRQDELERAWWEEEANLLTKSSSGAATPAVPAPGEGAGAAAAAEAAGAAERQADTLDWSYFVTECPGECAGAGAAAPCPVGSWGPFTACPAHCPPLAGWGQVACVCR